MAGRKVKTDGIVNLGDHSFGDSSGSGLQIDEEELTAAFEFFDVNGTGKLTAADLKQRLGAFYKNLPAKEYRMLISEPTFTKDTLRALLASNELGGYDPVREAFKVYDPNNTGFVDTETLRGIFGNLGYGEITDEDLKVLIATADADGDGKISREDFRQMLNFSRKNLQDPKGAGAS